MRARHWSLLPLAAATVTGAALAVAPLRTTSSCATTSDGGMTCSSTTQSLLASGGAAVLAIFAVPVLVTLVPVLWPVAQARVATAVLLSVATVLGMLSVGVFLLPTLALAWVAVAANRRQDHPSHLDASPDST